MRKVTLMVLGIAGLALLLCGSGELLAQTDRTAFPPGSAGSDAADSRLSGTTGTEGAGTTGAAGTQPAGTTGTAATGMEQATGGAGASSAELRQSVQQLQSEVAQLRQELAQVRAELARVNANPGVGGSGQAGMAPTAAPGATGAEQSTTTGTAPAQGTGGTASSGEAVVNAIYTGKVRSVSNKQLVLLDDKGQAFTVELSAQTRFLRNGQRISAQELQKGTRVRATVDLWAGHNQATEVTTLPER